MKFLFSVDPQWEVVQGGENPVLMRRGRTNQNALQITMNENKGGTDLGPKADFKGVAQDVARKMGGRPKSATATRGPKGSTTVRVPFDADKLAHAELWLLTDNVHIALATFCCDARPSAEELREVEKMMASITWQ